MKDKSIISFDVWDTLLKRKCNPEEIKLATAKHIYLEYFNELKEEYRNIYKLLILRDEIESKLCKENKSKGFDNECKILDVFTELKKEIFNKNNIKNFENNLLKFEINNEKDMTYINDDILHIFKKYKDYDMYCISDFYMSSDSLKEILDSKKFPVKFKKIYSSADYMLNKRSGRLFKKFEDDLKINPSNHIHVGDSQIVDVDVPKSLGIETIKMKNNVIPFEPKWDRGIDFKFTNYYKDSDKLEDKLYNIGLELSPLLYFYNYNLVEYAIKNKIDKIYYFTREGETFIKAYNVINENNPFGVDVPHAEILEVSRMGTFAPSLREFSIGELLRLWSQYRGQSMSSLFTTLNIDINKYDYYFKKYEIDPNQLINEPWFNVKVQNLFADDEFTSKIEKEISEKRKNLIEYFNNHGIFNDGRRLLTVDIGWRGTIQDNIAYIFDKDEIDGYYFTLFDFYNKQPKNTKKDKFINDKNFINKYVADIITLFEMLFSSNTGSVITYKDGKAVRKVKKEEVETVQNYVTYIQDGMLEGSKIINEQVRIHPYQSEEFEDYVKQLIISIKENPPKELIYVYYKLVMNDTFGTGKYVNKKKDKLNKVDRFNVLKVRKKLKNEIWKEAYMSYNHVEYFKYLMGFKKKARKIKNGKR